MRFKVTYLLSYKAPKFLILADYIQYELTVEVHSWWGLRKRTKVIFYKIWDHQDFKAHFDHWDDLIKNRKPLTI